jgi:hypothetical protein
LQVGHSCNLPPTMIAIFYSHVLTVV